jgi:hypothetical protein
MSQHINKNAHNKIQLTTSIKHLHVSTPGCHPLGVFQNKLLQAEHANVGTAQPSLERL